MDKNSIHISNLQQVLAGFRITKPQEGTFTPFTHESKSVQVNFIPGLEDN